MEEKPKAAKEQLLQNVEKLSVKLGIGNGEPVTVLQIRQSDQANQKILELKQGDWNDKRPVFVIDEDGSLMLLSSVERVQKMVASLHQMGEELFKVRLEQAIAREMPIDFNDVWVVATRKLQERLAQEKRRGGTVDLNALVRSIKKEHPNLFYSLQDFTLQPKEA